MKFQERIKAYLRNPRIPCNVVLEDFGKWLPDSVYLRLKWRIWMPGHLNLKAPKSYNEKLQWLKLYAYKPEYALLVDKYRVKDIVAKQIGDKYIIPTLGMWESPESIDFDSLPKKFVLKCNHDSGGLVICRDKNQLNVEKVRDRLSKAMSRNFYLAGRQKPYRDVKRCIFAEQYMEDSTTKELRDYKFFCFDGVVKSMFIASERQNRSEPYFDFFDSDFNHLDIKEGHPNSPILPQKPICFEEMKHLAETLSAGIPHVRVDFYEVDGSVFFGEMTFYHFDGMKRFYPQEIDYEWGSWLKLPPKTNYK